MLKMLLFTAILAVFIYIADQYLVPDYIHPEIWTLLAFFFALSLIGHRITSIGVQKNKDNVVMYYFAIMTIRLLVSIGILAFYMYKQTPDIYVLVFNFFMLYLFYVGFEINSLLTNLRRNSKQAESHEPKEPQSIS